MLDKDAISRQNASEQLLNITLFHAPEFTKDDVALSTLILEEIVTGTDQLNKVRRSQKLWSARILIV